MPTKPKTYYKSYTEATSSVYDYVSKDYIIDPNDWFNLVNIGGKPKIGQTKKSNGIGLFSIETKKPLKKALHIQVYRQSSDKFELNYYIM